MSSTNRVELGFVREVTPGTTPANPVFETILVNSIQSLGPKINTKVSDVITADRNVSDVIITDQSAEGQYSTPLIMYRMDGLIEEALMNTFTNKTTIVNTASQVTGVVAADSKFTFTTGGASFLVGNIVQTSGFSNSANNGVFLVATKAAGYITVTDLAGSGVTLVDDGSPAYKAMVKVVGYKCGSDDIDATSSGLTSTSLDFTTLGLAVGERIKIGGSASGYKFTTAANNDFVRISAIAANAMTFDVLPSGWSAENSSGSKTLQLFFGDVLRNGSTKIYSTKQVSYLDHDPVEYKAVSGSITDQFDLSFKQKDVVTCSFNVMGRATSLSDTAISGATTYSSSYVKELNSSNNVAQLLENNSLISSPNYVVGVDMSIKNNTQQIVPVGFSTSQDEILGEFDVSGTLDTYFGSGVYLQKLINNTPSSLTFKLYDGINGVYFYEIPKLKYTSGTDSVGGKNQSVQLNLGFQGLKYTNPANASYAIQVQRFFYVP